MDNCTLGYVLADLAHGGAASTGICLIDVDKTAKGGYEQWVVARQNDARRDYAQLVAGNLDFEAAARRWTKALVFVRSHHGAIGNQMSYGFVEELGALVEYVADAAEDAAEWTVDYRFDPFCPFCKTDTVIVDPDHDCGYYGLVE